MASLLALKYTPIPGGVRIAPVAMTNQSRTTSVLCHLSRFSTAIPMVFLGVSYLLYGVVILRVINVEAYFILAQR